jgi:quinolinate synthase
MRLHHGNDFSIKLTDNAYLADSNTEAGETVIVVLYPESTLFTAEGDFSIEDVANIREKYPEIKVIVHPECLKEVVNASDSSGSTQKIYNEVTNSPDDVKWAIGTEINFVQRLADNNPNKMIVPLRENKCYNMAKINLVNLAEAIESIDKYYMNGEELKNEVFVEEEYRENARIALKKMIEIVES